MCRILGYLGEPIDLEHVLFETDSSLVRQSYSPRMMAGFLNLAGFGMAAWDPRSVRGEDPFTYRVTTLPAFDRNLRQLSTKLAPTCLIAHVRGVSHNPREVVAETNVHPFRFPGARVQPPKLQPYGALVTFVHDPSGVLLHLCEWRPGATAHG